MIFKMLKRVIPLFLLMACHSNDIDAVVDDDNDDGEDNDLALSVELILEGSNFDELCGISRIDSAGNNYHLYFDRNLCTGNVKRSGEIAVTLVKGKDWSEAMAEMEIAYVDFTFEKVGQLPGGDKKYFGKRTLNGKETVVNLTGQTLADFRDKKTDLLKRRITNNNLHIVYNDNPRPLVYNKVAIREVQRANGEETILVKGDTSVLGHDQVFEWGVDRENQRFFNIIAQPLIRTLCDDRWIMTTGEKIRFSSTATKHTFYGVDQSGNTVGTCNAYGFKEQWLGTDGSEQTIIYRY